MSAVTNLEGIVTKERTEKFAAEKTAQDYSERLIREQERSRIYRELYEDTNKERLQLSERMQQFAGFIREDRKVEGSDKKEPISIGKRYVPWREQQRILSNKLAERWKAKGAEPIVPEGVISGT